MSIIFPSVWFSTFMHCVTSVKPISWRLLIWSPYCSSGVADAIPCGNTTGCLSLYWAPPVPRICDALVLGGEDRNMPRPNLLFPVDLEEGGGGIVAAEDDVEGCGALPGSRWNVWYSYLARMWRSMLESWSSCEIGAGCFWGSGLNSALDFVLPIFRMVWVGVRGVQGLRTGRGVRRLGHWTTSPWRWT